MVTDDCGVKAAGAGEKVFRTAKSIFEKSFPPDQPENAEAVLRSVCLKTLRTVCSQMTERVERITELTLSSEDIPPRKNGRASVFERKNIDTPENRFAKSLIKSAVKALKHAVKNARGSGKDGELSSIAIMTKRLERRLKSGTFSYVSDGGADISAEGLADGTGLYAGLYEDHLMLKTAAGVFPLPPVILRESGRAEEEDVLVGSLGSETQLEINLRDGFYYTPLSVTDQSKKVRFVALYRSASSVDPGIRYYGEIAGSAVKDRGDIPVPLRRFNPEEPYVYYEIKEWNTLERPILPKGEGVAGPRYTYFFLLKNSRNTEELFRSRPQNAYALLSELGRLYGASAQTAAEEKPGQGERTPFNVFRKILVRVKKLFGRGA